jgi:murein DD-endopeptidase MepM/ murein hydrolase activator NlpD
LFFLRLKKNYVIFIAAFLASLIAVFVYVFNSYSTISAKEETEKKFIRYVEFNPTFEALEFAMNEDIKSSESEIHINWIEILSYLGAKYGGDFKKYKQNHIPNLMEKVKKGEKIEELSRNKKLYNYYKEAYGAVLDGFLGCIQGEEKKYGLTVFSPIAKTFPFCHYDDFGASRDYGYSRPHLGHDLMCATGTPVIAVESGVAESIGWNQYGGWRIGIRSHDRKRYWYYAHLRKNRPFHVNLKEGENVEAGNVIGYVGRTGYSSKENVNNISQSHLHIGLELIFDESQKESNNEIWVNLYEITKLLEKNKSNVTKQKGTKDFFAKNQKQ